MAIHLLVGVIWAVFYAYFFWSVLSLKPLWQGLVFTLAPTTLAVLVVYPQLYLMQAASGALETNPLRLFQAVSWEERGGLLLGHIVYGLALGAIYTHPVGRPAAETPAVQFSPRRRRSVTKRNPERAESAFIFATGIEGSNPTIEHGRWRRDQMRVSNHYRLWERDLERCIDVGITHLRYGPPLHAVFLGPDRFDWSFSDLVFGRMRELGITPIADLCHFGLPGWLETFQNPEAPVQLAGYASAFADRYPDVRFYTPVNEMYVCAKLSALHGVWNEQRRDERSFVTAVGHLAKANSLMMEALLRRRPDAVFVNSESGELYQAASPDPEIVRIADFENERRFLALDLLYGNPVSERMHSHLTENGMAPAEYDWFMARKTPARTILGVDYYLWNEQLIDTKGRAQALGELFGWYVVATQYWERYRRPMMHTETNHMDAREAPRWLWRQWHNIRLIQKAGVPVVGFTWYSLTDQVDWDIALAEALGNVNPVGLFDLNRDPRPVALAYKYLIERFGQEPDLRDYPPLKSLMQ
jgi:beta-glucosidase/6-phospho-beta-glucosidase/beta-galactosidase